MLFRGDSFTRGSSASHHLVVLIVVVVVAVIAVIDVAAVLAVFVVFAVFVFVVPHLQQIVILIIHFSP